MSLPDLVKHYDRPGPRYTGYPMPPAWKEGFPEEELHEALSRANEIPDPLSIYVHLPFCHRRCAYCGCNAVPSRRYTPVEPYLEALERETTLWASRLPDRRDAIQLHWGGGTPTFLKSPDLRRAFGAITHHFQLLPEAEVAVEVDPTFLEPDQLPTLRELGFNRVSFGVQDLDERVQALITRGQTWEQTRSTVLQARELGFQGINLDLVYGLPGQTRETFRRTLEATLDLSPDRMAIYGFAYLPQMLPHQKQLDPENLPPPELRLELLLMATEILETGGYVAIGMDHFARPGDPLARALQEGRLIRNFMGYAVQAGTDSLGFGPSAISQVGGVYAQNEKLLGKWEAAIAEGRFALQKGHRLSQDDLLRRWVIHRVMGTFALRWDELEATWGVDGQTLFASALEELRAEEPFGTVRITPEGVFVTDLGKRFVRNMAMPFDAYLRRMAPDTVFSRTV
nr:oxygen-independent coproporphyrinogen III oxidase [uncultured Holophaga sp.]